MAQPNVTAILITSLKYYWNYVYIPIEREGAMEHPQQEDAMILGSTDEIPRAYTARQERLGGW